MNKKTKKLLIIGGVGIAAFGAYWYFSQSSAGSSSSATPVTPLTPLAPASNTVPAAAPTSYTNPNGAVVPAWLIQWAAAPGPDAAIYQNTVWPNISPSDLANLINIVQNYFNTGAAVPASLANWWNGVFRPKYNLA